MFRSRVLSWDFEIYDELSGCEIRFSKEGMQSREKECFRSRIKWQQSTSNFSRTFLESSSSSSKVRKHNLSFWESLKTANFWKKNLLTVFFLFFWQWKNSHHNFANFVWNLVIFEILKKLEEQFCSKSANTLQICWICRFNII